jgi:hypothetical protein
MTVGYDRDALGRLGGSTLVCVLMLAVTACGGDSSSSGGDWDVIGTAESKARAPVLLKTNASRPAEIELDVESEPSVKASATYTFTCGISDEAIHKTNTVTAKSTPYTARLVVPEGEASLCFLNVLAEKAAPADMTVTVRVRKP